MPTKLLFDSAALHTVAGGKSVLDTPQLHIKSFDEANAFIRGYGFDPEDPADLDKPWYYYRRAYVLLTEKLGYAESDIPEVLRDKKGLKDIRQLLLYASEVEEKICQRWACALLRAVHVFVHSENDLFSTYSSEIQKQILTPFESQITNYGGVTALKPTADHLDSIELEHFEIKPFKTSTSTVIKLLAKRDALAMRVYDKLGVRFVTRNTFDSFQVLRLLVEENMISYPHIMPDQSSNNTYPVGLFVDTCQELLKEGKSLTSNQISEVLDLRLSQMSDETELFRKENSFSGTDHRFIKFITRQLIHIHTGDREKFSFFFPYEVQIMEYGAYQKVLNGPSEHGAYKERQQCAAKARLFPE